MRKVNWNERLSGKDIAWLLQTGIRNIENKIREHQARFGDEFDPEAPEDVATRSALDPSARGDEGRVVTPGQPELVDPTKMDPLAENEDDYESWTKSELEAEVPARNGMPDTTSVEVVGTGANGSVKKEDLIKALRLWDQENPDALKD